ncbi:phage regulatory protein/antirepressor Ant [Lacticaseibacillus sp. 53-4]|uniref:phage regulatory protein/antirepressor Ant n=1 Tax=Lacticaseibacillus sp. 53-4 TaxID=2799575 RepID=UPI00194095C4|nr:phage regulatory protein/antirepressor Ant [Lacticaseibacillus sp. 53-4]
MNELVIMHDRQAVTTSLRIAEVFGKQHKDVLEAIGNLAAENSAAKFFAAGTYENRGKQYPMYYMNRDGFTLLAVGFTGRRALQFKISYINAFNSMETQIKTGYVIPGSYAEALKLAASQAEQIEDMKPKALFADAVATSHTTILVGELAKLLRQNGVDIGQNRLFKMLRDQGYLINRKGSDWNMPTQRSMDMKLFRVKETTIGHSDGSVSISKTVKVTGKGQQYFINKFLRTNEPQTA